MGGTTPPCGYLLRVCVGAKEGRGGSKDAVARGNEVLPSAHATPGVDESAHLLGGRSAKPLYMFWWHGE